MCNITNMTDVLNKIRANTHSAEEFIFEAEAIIKSSNLSAEYKLDAQINDLEWAMAKAWAYLPNYVEDVDTTYVAIRDLGKMNSLIKAGYDLHLAF